MTETQHVTNDAQTATDVEERPTATAPVTTGGKSFTEQEVEQIIKDRLARETAKREKAAKEAADKAAAEAAAKNGEWQKLAEEREKKLQELEAQVKAAELVERKRKVAQTVGLPESLAARLVGTTDEELTADAKALLETLPKAPQRQPGPTNPGANGQQGETVQQRLMRIHGGGTGAFDFKENS